MKKEKVFKIIGVIILILFILAFIYFIRNLIIVNKITTAYNDFFSSNNYSYSVIYDNGKYKCYFKDGKNLENFMSNGKISTIIWSNKNAQENMIIYPNSLTANTTNSEIPTFIDIINSLVSNNNLDKIYRALTFYIDTAEINGEICYVFHPLVGITSNTYYFSKETGNVVRCLIGNLTFDFMDFETNSVTDNDVLKPNLTGYNILEH